MRIISKKPFDEAATKYPNESAAIKDVYRVMFSGRFITPDELKARFGSLDRFKYRDKWWVIDIGGNNLRLIAYIKFETQNVYIKHIESHKEYDRLTDYYRRTKE
ncbi:type II toxin-antitoxin system HigB family toxin [Rouxiella badensis]|uniref:type II toxin-antitoxin system HigB family toxin n=1 Tax=Rouxiella badensis TaxID=1646377 RepID=UPI00301E2072